MGHKRFGHLVISAILVFVGAASLSAQRVPSNPSAAEIAAMLRTRGEAYAAVPVLTQVQSPQSRKRMDDIADSLVAIAVSFPGNDRRAITTRTAALLTLVKAGRGSSGVVGIERATPYAGAADRVMQIAEMAKDVGIRAAALDGLVGFANKAKYLPFLQQIATSRGSAALKAVTLLTMETGPEGQAVARALYRDGKVTEARAKEMLEGAAETYGWK
jgi:hypothetical protein